MEQAGPVGIGRHPAVIACPLVLVCNQEVMGSIPFRSMRSDNAPPSLRCAGHCPIAPARLASSGPRFGAGCMMAQRPIQPVITAARRLAVAIPRDRSHGVYGQGPPREYPRQTRPCRPHRSSLDRDHARISPHRVVGDTSSRVVAFERVVARLCVRRLPRTAGRRYTLVHEFPVSAIPCPKPMENSHATSRSSRPDRSTR